MGEDVEGAGHNGKVTRFPWGSGHIAVTEEGATEYTPRRTTGPAFVQENGFISYEDDSGCHRGNGPSMYSPAEDCVCYYLRGKAIEAEDFWNRLYRREV